MMSSIEEYLEAIYELTEKGVQAKTSELAKMLKVTPASVTEMLQKLANQGYVKYEPYYGAKLTPEGEEIARKIKRKHRLVERFLHDVLKIDKLRVHSEACKLEHAVSDEVEEALCRFMGAPERCPDGEREIPICDKDVESCEECERVSERRGVKLLSLCDLSEGEEGEVRFVRGGRGVLQRLACMGIVPGTRVKVLRSLFRGPVEVEVRGSKIAIGRGIACRVFVERNSK